MPIDVSSLPALLCSRLTRTLFVVAVACVLAPVTYGARSSGVEQEVRALWVTRLSLASPESSAASRVGCAGVAIC